MTADECFDAAAARCAEFSVKVPGTRTTAYARINRRQQQLFAHVATLEPEVFGRNQAAVLAAGVYDLANLSPLASRVTYVEILDPGTSGYAVGTKVTVLQVFDPAAEIPPRATLRDAVLEQVGTDLALVTSVRIHYSKQPAVVDAGTDVLEFLEQFLELLVIDLTKMLVRKSIALDSGEGTKGTGFLELLEAEEKDLMADLRRHCEHWRFAEVARFRHSQTPTREPIA